MSVFFNNFFSQLNEKNRNIDIKELIAISDLIIKTNENKGKIIIVGNGGSAAIASHVSIDLSKSANIRSINFNESSLLTCFSNDYGYESWVEKAIEMYSDKNDLIILISSSGNSKNIINGAIKAKLMGLSLITLSGFQYNNKLNQLGDVNLWVESDIYNIIENVHQVWLLSIIDFIVHKKSLGATIN